MPVSRRGFGSEELFLSFLDRVLAGQRISQVARSAMSQEAREQAVRKAVHEKDSIPVEHKESVIRASLEKMSQSETGCEHGLEYYAERFERHSGGRFALEILPEGKSVFIEFHADWCLPCKKQEVALERYAQWRGGEFVLLKVERDKDKMHP